MTDERREVLNNTAIGILFALPYITIWFLFMVLPIGYGFYISLHEWNPILGSEFVGFENYRNLLGRERFWNSFWVTAEFSAYVVPLIIAIGLAFAIMLHNTRVIGAGWVEGAFFFPYLLNVSVVSIVWVFVLDGNVGIIPYYLRQLGLSPPTFLNNPYWVVPVIAFVSAWWLAGYRMVLFRAGLQTIPTELYESAAIDGAGGVRSFFLITLPLLKPTLLFATVVTLVGGMRSVGQVIIMTNGGPGNSSEVLALYMYRLAFDFFRFGEAAAIGFILFAIVFGLSLLLFWLFGTESELK